jgi:hypothetical protein
MKRGRGADKISSWKVPVIFRRFGIAARSDVVSRDKR